MESCQLYKNYISCSWFFVSCSGCRDWIGIRDPIKIQAPVDRCISGN